MCPTGFVPHGFTGRVRLLSPLPRIIIPASVHDDMWAIIHAAESNEVGWLGLVSREDMRFRIEEVFVPDQEVSTSTTVISTQGQSDMMMGLLARENGDALWSRLRFWGHSHVRMSTDPSWQDDIQLERFMSPCDWFVRGIANQHGRFEFSVFLKSEGVVVEDVPWEIEPPAYAERFERWLTQVTAQARERVPVTATSWESSEDDEPLSIARTRRGLLGRRSS